MSSSPGSVAVGDFNNDNKMDLVVANGNGGGVSLFLGDDLGGFASPTDFHVGSRPVFVARGDFDNDAKGDIAVADFDGDLWVVLGDGNGGFGIPTGYPIGIQPYMVVVGKFNDDSIVDLAVGDYSNGGEVSVLLGNGDGTFGPANSFPAGTFPLGIAVGDFDGNGRDDLAVANLTTNTVSVLLSNADGSFAAPTAFAVGNNPVFVAVADFNGDLKQDLVVANANLGGGDGTVSVLRGDGLGGFGPPTNFTVGQEPLSVVVGHFNGDDKLDLAIVNNDSKTVSVLLGAGGGTFESAVNFALDHSPGFLVAGDFYGDGQTDLVVSNFDNTLSVLLNACGYPVHDTVVLTANPVSVTIPAGTSTVTKKIAVKVRNADTTTTAGYRVKLAVDGHDCGGGVTSTPDFLRSQSGAQDIVQVADGKTKTAKVVLTLNASAFTSFNRNSPHRCTVWFTSSPRQPNGAQLVTGDPTPSNNVMPVELSITDRNDPDQTDVHQTTIASLKPITLNIASGQVSKTMNVRPKVGNADAGEAASEHSISATVATGSCPPGTVGAVDFSSQSGTQSAVPVAGGTKKRGKLAVTASNGLCTPNKLAPLRCIATVRAIGPIEPDLDPTNNTTRLVIDVIDKNDISGICSP